MKYTYYTFDFSKDPKLGIIEDIDNVENEFIDDFMLNEGISVKTNFPSDCELQFDNDGGDFVTDFIENIDELVLISERTKTIFEKFIKNEESIEYLPFNLLNRKGKPASEIPYYIANTLMNISNCIDFEAIKEKAVCYGIKDDERTIGGVFYIDGKVSRFTVICLKEKELPEDAVLFRIGELPNHIVIRSDLVDALKKAGVTNLNLIPNGDEL